MWRTFRTALNRPAPTPALFALLIALSVSLCSVADQAAAQGTGEPITIVAHRGGAGLYPENTLAAIRHALDLGVDAIEVDAQRTADGEVVLYHEFQLNPDTTRIPGGRWLLKPGEAIATLSLAEIQVYDVGTPKPGSVYASKHPEVTAVEGERAPTLRDAIRLVKAEGVGRERLWVEIKTDPTRPEISGQSEATAEAIVEVLRSERFLTRANLLSFDWNALKRAREIAPGVRTTFVTMDPKWLRSEGGSAPSLSVEERKKWLAGIDLKKHNGSLPQAIASQGGLAWSAFHGDLTPEMVTDADRLGIRVGAWTVNNVARARELAAIGVTAFTTDRPDVLLAALGRGATGAVPAAPTELEVRDDGN